MINSKIISPIFLFSLFGCTPSSNIILYGPNYQLPTGYIEDNKLANKKVIFLPQYPEVQHYGYQSYYFRQNNYFSHPEYNDLVGKTAEIIGIKEGSFPSAILRVDEKNWILFTHLSSNVLQEVGFLSEMENAKQYIGKTVWNKAHPTDSSTDRYGYIRCERKIGKFEDVEIIDIQWSPDDYSPIRYVFKTKDGLQGYWDGTFSRINEGDSDMAQLFSENWYFEDPHIIYSDWSQKIWDAIENEKIFIGMTDEQAFLSWGKPRKNNRSVGVWGSHEQWVYDSQYLYFENGKLTSFQSN